MPFFSILYHNVQFNPHLNALTIMNLYSFSKIQILKMTLKYTMKFLSNTHFSFSNICFCNVFSSRNPEEKKKINKNKKTYPKHLHFAYLLNEIETIFQLNITKLIFFFILFLTGLHLSSVVKLRIKIMYLWVKKSK